MSRNKSRDKHIKAMKEQPNKPKYGDVVKTTHHCDKCNITWRSRSEHSECPKCGPSVTKKKQVKETKSPEKKNQRKWR